ncbi:hypothetical protein [Alkalinema sp. FACHB-956]|uniref:hypothetical protein n=1 Tax=Alkalinema sp. FACHB-956 TaxID=2692768 RepID=UPI0016824284|nr:hypothetical protein [Alkalinema sp. FACHB-956]MBD2326040.1 hypothetical protein [Alkalinema sp. FACHB-956]
MLGVQALECGHRVIQTWHDRKISVGTECAQAIDDNLNTAGISLLLISVNFLASDYCYSILSRPVIWASLR